MSRLPKGYLAISGQIAALEHKKAKIYKEIEELQAKLQRSKCPHPVKYRIEEKSHHTDTLGNNGGTTLYMTCGICKHMDSVEL